MRRDLQNITKKEVIARLVYIIYQLGFIVVVGGFLCLVLMFFGINPKEHAAIIGCAVGGAWYRKQQELAEEVKKQNDEQRGSETKNE